MATARLTLVDAIAQSCDVYFYDLARKVGVDAIAEMARRFGLGQRLNIDLPGERPGLVPDRAWKLATRGVPWQKGETLVVGIGQGFMQATPLQLAVMTARIANGSQAIRPWLVQPPGGAEGAAEVAPLGVSEWALGFVKRGHASGDQRRARHRARSAAAQPRHRHGGQDRHLSGAPDQPQRAPDRRAQERGQALGRARPRLFVAFAPYRKPRYAIAVVVEHGGSGSKAAAPIARDIMAKALELDPARTPSPVTLERRSRSRAARPER